MEEATPAVETTQPTIPQPMAVEGVPVTPLIQPAQIPAQELAVQEPAPSSVPVVQELIPPVPTTTVPQEQIPVPAPAQDQPPQVPEVPQVPQDQVAQEAPAATIAPPRTCFIIYTSPIPTYFIRTSNRAYHRSYFLGGSTARTARRSPCNTTYVSNAICFFFCSRWTFG